MNEIIAKEVLTHEVPLGIIRIVGESWAKKELQPNQDSFFILHGKGAGVFDGVQSENHSEQASSFAASKIKRELRNLTDSKENFSRKLKEILRETDLLLYENSDKIFGKTTASVVFMSGNRAYFANIGDSRIYLIRRNNLIQLTLDDGVIKKYYKDPDLAFKIQRKLSEVVSLKQLTDEEVSLWQQRNIIYNWLGTGSAEINVSFVDLEAGDKLLLTTDGIHDNLTDSEIKNCLLQENDTNRKINILLATAFARSKEKGVHFRAKADDATAVLLEYLEPSSPEDISKAKNFDELKDIISRLKEGGLVGSNYFYTNEELLNIIEDVMKGLEPIEIITRAGGLRQKIIELLSNKKNN